jgi:4-hydroxybenzoate polyprenyltransferase
MMRAAAVIFALTRLDTCALVFFSILLPVYFHQGDFVFSLEMSLPVLTICMCGFVINDLSDIEKDRENHPLRPLPSRAINELAASIVYFGLLAASLVAIKLYVAPSLVYLYVLLLIALINYNYVVAYVPAAKTVYVAIVGLIPVFILASIIGGWSTAARIAPSLFLFLLGRELLMDVQDSRGDGKTLAKTVGFRITENSAFVLKFLGTAGLCLAVGGITDVVLVVLLLLLDILFVWGWKRRLYRRAIIHLMKLQLLVGIYFLIEQTTSAAAL